MLMGKPPIAAGLVLTMWAKVCRRNNENVTIDCQALDGHLPPIPPVPQSGRHSPEPRFPAGDRGSINQPRSHGAAHARAD